jgi:hypothetical protein
MQVYASDNKETISISLISGPCEVLTSDRFQQENDKRNQLADSNNNLPPIFLCRYVCLCSQAYLGLVLFAEDKFLVSQKP